MRISTLQIYRQGTHGILDHQGKLTRVQQQLASGRRLLDPAEDPFASGQLLRVRQQNAATEQHQRNIDFARGRLGMEEAALEEAGNLLQRARELTLQGQNGTLSAEDRHIIADEVRELLGQMQGLANTQDGNGEYLFSGSKSKTMPFVQGTGGQVIYQGDEGQRRIDIGPSRALPVGDSGVEVFGRMRNGNGQFRVDADPANSGNGTIDIGSVIDSATFEPHRYRIEFTSAERFNVIDQTTSTAVLSDQTYAAGSAIEFGGMHTSIHGTPAAGDSFSVEPASHQDLFATLDKLAAALESPAGSPAAQARITQSLNNSLADLDQGMEHVRGAVSRIGTRQNALDIQYEANQDFTLRLEQMRTNLDGLDYAEAATRMNAEMLALEVAQQTFTRVQSLSLFSYLR